MIHVGILASCAYEDVGVSPEGNPLVQAYEWSTTSFRRIPDTPIHDVRFDETEPGRWVSVGRPIERPIGKSAESIAMGITAAWGRAQMGRPAR